MGTNEYKAKIAAIKAKLAAKVEHDDVAFLKNPDNWPNWPVCPIKRIVDDSRQCALVFDHNNKDIIVARLNMFRWVEDGYGNFREWTKEDFDNSEKWEYDTVEDLIADGWIVD